MITHRCFYNCCYLNTVRCDDISDINNETSIAYTPPRVVSAALPSGQRYIGTIVTYSCSLGYQLVGGSSLRACGPDGTWNGTESACGEQAYSFLFRIKFKAFCIQLLTVVTLTLH